ncbi:hypothetical protein [Streptomyces parvulus]
MAAEPTTNPELDLDLDDGDDFVTLDEPAMCGVTQCCSEGCVGSTKCS